MKEKLKKCDYELKDMIKHAAENNIDELDFFIKALEVGFSLEDFKEAGHYDYAKDFMQQHGLL